MRPFEAALLLLLLVPPAGAPTPLPTPAAQSGWVWLRTTDAGRIYKRDLKGAPAPMIMILTRFEASPEQVRAVVTDYDHFAEFIPHVEQSRVLARQGDSQWVFHHLSFPGPVADRAYVIRSTQTRPAGQSAYRVEWRLARRQFSDADLSAGVRPEALSGFWSLRRAADGSSTEARYAIQVDPGGWIPGWLVESMTERYAQQVVQAVQTRLRSD